MFMHRYNCELTGRLLTLAKQEVMDVLERTVDSQTFLEAFNLVQSQLQTKREDRKRTAAAEAITNPHAFAKRKMAKNLKKRAAVKRKVKL